MARNALGIAGRTLLIASLALALSMLVAPNAQAADDDEHSTANAESLVPSQTVGWYAPMLYGVAGLFIAAIVVGIARDAAGIKDPGIAAGEYDQAHAHHDDHGHDDHSHSHDDHDHGDHGHKH